MWWRIHSFAFLWFYQNFYMKLSYKRIGNNLCGTCMVAIANTNFHPPSNFQALHICKFFDECRHGLRNNFWIHTYRLSVHHWYIIINNELEINVQPGI